VKALLIILGGLALAGVALAEDLEAGRKVAAMCRTCHGLDGVARLPNSANIGGEPEDYLARQLEAFRSGERTDEMMRIVAAGLTDEQIADVAAWYAAQTATAAIDRDPAAAPALCVACHGADGIAVAEDTPNLAGESATYLRRQLEAFREGNRKSDVMEPIARELSEADLLAAVDWYAATRLTVAPPN
jgi:cytochrome c553